MRGQSAQFPKFCDKGRVAGFVGGNRIALHFRIARQKRGDLLLALLRVWIGRAKANAVGTLAPARIAT